MQTDTTVKAAFAIYNYIWSIIIPALKFNHRIKEGYRRRILKDYSLPRSDIWIQSASAGEAFLTTEFLKAFKPERPVKILLTTTTSQGFDTLIKGVTETKPELKGIDTEISYLPFDKPSLMKKAVKLVDPSLMILMESEIWPGLMKALCDNKTEILILNGRMTEKSYKRYKIWPNLWKSIKPSRVNAISPDDAERFKNLFELTNVRVVDNIKFDRFNITPLENSKDQDLFSLKNSASEFIVLGSVRQEEEELISQLISDLFTKKTDAVIGLFPRHMHRVDYWKETLEKKGLTWSLRSEKTNDYESGSVVLWDKFGELSLGYSHADAAFVGGSLSPLGGQNFLEVLSAGIIPVIGPSWSNFSWVGEEIISRGLLKIGKDWKEVSALLTDNLNNPVKHERVVSEALDYIKTRQGGTEISCNEVLDMIYTK